MRKSLLTSLLFTIFSTGVQAQGIFTALTCNRIDVNNVINGPTHVAVNGDTILVPAGNCIWTQGVTVNVLISIIGNGVPNSLATQYGAGTINTVITYNFSSGGVFVFNLPVNRTNIARISTIDIEPINGTTALNIPISLVGTCDSFGCPQLRIDNVAFGLTTPFTSTNTSVLIAEDGIYGVADHNTMPSGSGFLHFIDTENSSWLGVGTYGDNSWASPDTFGGVSQFFVENNILYTQDAFSDMEKAASGGAIGGGRVTFRFNQLHIVTTGQPSGVHGCHGNDTNGRPRSCRNVEQYAETIDCAATGTTSCGAGLGLRGGTAITFGNTYTKQGTTRWSAPVSASIYRTGYTPPQFGACGGSSVWDTNDGIAYFTGTMTAASGSGVLTMTDTLKNFNSVAEGTLTPAGAPYSVYDTTQQFWAEIKSNTTTSITIQPFNHMPAGLGFNNGDSYQIQRATVCTDQPGRGIGILLNGTTPTPPTPASPVNQALDPIRTWDNVGVFGNGNFSPDSVTGNRLLINRDFFTGGTVAQTSSTSPFNGTSGVGFGLITRRPSTCTSGTAYWATDLGNWNKSSNTYAGGFSQGQLFVCGPSPTINVDLVYTGNSSTVGTAATSAIGNASTVSNNCTPGTCAQWQTPSPLNTFFVGANQNSCNNLVNIAVNNGGPTYAPGALNFNNIQFNNAFTYWQLSLSPGAPTNNATFGVCVTPLPTVPANTIDLLRMDDSFGRHVWGQVYKCADGHYGFHIETSVLTTGGSSRPCIEPGDSLFPGPFLISMNWNQSVNGLGMYGSYASGGSVTGASGSVCAVTFAGGTGYTTLQATNSLVNGGTFATIYGVATPGTPWTVAPTSAILSNWPNAQDGPATSCSGTITISGATLGGVSTIAVHNATTGALIGQLQVSTAFSTTTLNNMAFSVGNEENFSTAVTWYFQNLISTWTGTVPQDIYVPLSVSSWPSSPNYTPFTYPHPLISSISPAPAQARIPAIFVKQENKESSTSLTKRSK